MKALAARSRQDRRQGRPDQVVGYRPGRCPLQRRSASPDPSGGPRPPRATSRWRFQLCNRTAAPATVALDPAAATIVAGSFTVPTGRAVDDLSSWISADPPTATLAAGKRLIATATFHVPAPAVQEEPYAALLAELSPSANMSGIVVIDRTGARVDPDVGPGGDPLSDFTIDSLQSFRDSNGVAHVLARVRNTGARALTCAASWR